LGSDNLMEYRVEARRRARAVAACPAVSRQGLLSVTKTLKDKRDRALLLNLLGCGRRRRELAELNVEDLQRREDH
jgi:hypothetical protein